MERSISSQAVTVDTFILSGQLPLFEYRSNPYLRDEATKAFKEELLATKKRLTQTGCRRPRVRLTVSNISEYTTVAIGGHRAYVVINNDKLAKAGRLKTITAARYEGFRMMSNYNIPSKEFESLFREWYPSVASFNKLLFNVVDKGIAHLEEITLFQTRAEVKSDSVLTHGLLVLLSEDYRRMFLRISEHGQKFDSRSIEEIKSQDGKATLIYPTHICPVPTSLALLHRNNNDLDKLERRILKGGPEGLLKRLSALRVEDLEEQHCFVLDNGKQISEVYRELLNRVHLNKPANIGSVTIK